MVFYSNCHLSANKGARDHFVAGIKLAKMAARIAASVADAG